MPSTSLISIAAGYNRSPSPVYLAPAIRLGSTQERESFDFFTSHAVFSLRGFIDSPFWQREVLQAAYRDPAIQHCVVALGAMHRRFHEGHTSHIQEADLMDKHLQFALRQSNQAIQDLVRKQSPNGQLRSVDKVTLMTCSILFSSMSCLQGHQRDAFEHLRSGIRMLNEMDEQAEEAKESHPVDVESLRTLLVGLDMQARSIRASADTKFWVARPKASTSTILPDPDLSMASLLTMLRYLESLLNHLYAFFQGTVTRSVAELDDIYQEYYGLIDRYQRGAAILNTLCEKVQPGDVALNQSLAALQLLRCEIEYLLRSPRSDIEARFGFIGHFKYTTDPFDKVFDAETQFAEMFELAAKLLPVSTATTPVFTTSVGPISALFLIAMRAPSTCATLRRRAVSLMLNKPRREGFWDGMVAGQIAQQLLDLEQESTHAELGLTPLDNCDLIVPDDLRMVAVAISHPKDTDRQAKAVFSNTRDLDEGRPGVVRWISW